MLAIVFLTASQSAFFSPARYGILPEMLPDKCLSRANGLGETSIFLAVIVGTAAGSVMFDAWRAHVEWIGYLLIVIAIVGSLTSLGIARGTEPSEHRRFSPWPWTEIARGIGEFRADRPLWLTVLGRTPDGALPRGGG